jgi:hypothetical protein
MAIRKLIHIDEDVECDACGAFVPWDELTNGVCDHCLERLLE